jgi:uncharacterized membrane protein
MPETIRTIADYLEQLRGQLAGSDPALIQDALYDTEEHLRNELAATGDQDETGEQLVRVIERYGTPQEVAEAYRANELTVATALAHPAAPAPESGLAQVVGIFTDPKAYSSLLYMYLSLLTGIIYFTWVVTGVALSLGFSVMIFGIPFFLLFLATVRAISQVEGRLVEAMLGVRMPRRPVFGQAEGGWWQRFKFWLTDTRSWLTMLYMAVKLPLGVLSFSLFVVLLSLSLGLLLDPFAQLLWEHPIISTGRADYYLPLWAAPLLWLAGISVLTATLHAARWLGRLQGSLAKKMLVGSG